jgi:hypothetical protein
MWAYAMIATGLINWDYQRALPNIAVKSLVIILPGALLFTLTFIRSTHRYLQSRLGKSLVLFIGALSLAYAFIN